MGFPLDARSNSDKFKELTDLVQSKIEKLHIPGAVIGLWVDDQEYTAGLGVSSLEKPSPMTPATLFEVASITKTVTTTALFRLIDQGRLDLDDPVRHFIPDFRVQNEDTSARVTLRQVLNHTSGWMGDFFIHTTEGDDGLAQYVKEMAGLEQVTPLGSLYAYNNAAFNVAGRILEIASGQPYEQAIQELVLTPLGLSNSFFFPEDAGSRPVTRGHRVRNGEIVSAEPWTSSRALAPCGGLASSVSDLLRYAQFHCGNGTTPDGQRILTPGSLKTMQTPTIATEENGWMGLNWFIDDVDGTRFIRHCGQSNGQNSLYWMVPDRNFAFVLLVNLDPCGTIQSEMTNWVREHFLGIVTPEPRRMPITENQLNSYCGFYRLPPEEDPYELSRSGEDLILTQHTLQPTHWRLFCCAPDDFCMLDGPFEGRKLKFERGADQQVTLFRVDGRVSLKTP